MRGTSRLWQLSFVGALTAGLFLSGCNRSEGSSTANDIANQEPNPSGVMETGGSMTPVALENVGWALLELNGKPIAATSDATAPYLELNAAKKSAYGFGGCNRFFGSYEVGKNQALTFGAIGATRMACRDGMNQEQELFTTLGQTTQYRIDGSKLLLYAGDDLVARFQARDLLKTD